MAKPTKDQEKENRDAYLLCDKDNKGLITHDDLATMVRALGVNPTNAEIQNMKKELNGCYSNEKSSYENFTRLVHKKRNEEKNNNKLEKAFEVLDKNKTGYITVAQLRHIMTSQGDRLTSQEVEEMINYANQDENGKIDYKAFATLLRSLPYSWTQSLEDQ